MSTVERILSIAKERGISVAKLERDCGFSNGYLKKLLKGTLPNDRLSTVAEYLGVSAEYLTTGEEAENYYVNTETLEMAQQLYENPGLHMLFDITKDATPSELKDFYDVISIMKKRERGES